MGVILDILGSFVVRAAIVVVILNLMINLHQELSKSSDRIMLNTSMYGYSDTSAFFRNKYLGGVSQVIAADIRLAGYNAVKTFAIAKINEISFSADTGNTGTSQIIRYYTNPATPSSVNKAILYRTVDAGTPLEVARDIITFRIAYYKVDGSLASFGTNVNQIKSIYITLSIASNMTERKYQGALDDTLALQTKWENHFFPENL